MPHARRLIACGALHAIARTDDALEFFLTRTQTPPESPPTKETGRTIGR